MIDYYDKIADALEAISGDSSHKNDVSPNMDYYERIANALEVIVQNGIGSSNQAGIVYASITAAPTEVQGVYTYHCDKTLTELLAAINSGAFVFARHGDVFSPLSGYTNSSVVFQDISIGLNKVDFNTIVVSADSVTITKKEVTYDTQEEY